MESQSHATPFTSPPKESRCPFLDGPLTLDGLLAELGTGDAAAFDVALDLRGAMVAGLDARECVALALRLRRALDGRHYLAFYRVRRWLSRTIELQARPWRGESWRRYALPLDCARLDEVENTAVARLASELGCDQPLSLAQVRFAFCRQAGLLASG